MRVRFHTLHRLSQQPAPGQWHQWLANHLAWLSCAAASHCGFAIVEGLLGTFGDEGPLKVIVGRSFGAACHCSWGIIAAWFAYRGWNRWRLGALIWPIALLLPAVLHSILNASIMELPGDGISDADNATSVTEFLVVLSGMASMLVTFTLSAWCVYSARIAPAAHPLHDDYSSRGSI